MGRRRRFARIILIDGPLSTGPGNIGWVTASVAHSTRFEVSGRVPDQPEHRAVHEYELIPERSSGNEQQARWVRWLRIEPIPPAHGTTRGIPEYERRDPKP
jgi:hypothetical protein